MPLNREIDFDFDFDSFVRAGEAKLRGRETSAPLPLGPRVQSFPPPPPPPSSPPRPRRSASLLQATANGFSLFLGCFLGLTEVEQLVGFLVLGDCHGFDGLLHSPWVLKLSLLPWVLSFRTFPMGFKV